MSRGSGASGSAVHGAPPPRADTTNTPASSDAYATVRFDTTTAGWGAEKTSVKRISTMADPQPYRARRATHVAHSRRMDFPQSAGQC